MQFRQSIIFKTVHHNSDNILLDYKKKRRSAIISESKHLKLSFTSTLPRRLQTSKKFWPLIGCYLGMTRARNLFGIKNLVAWVPSFTVSLKCAAFIHYNISNFCRKDLKNKTVKTCLKATKWYNHSKLH